MSVNDLYSELLLDHADSPRNTVKLDPANGPSKVVAGENPLCGDRLLLNLQVKEGRIVGISIDPAGCAISTASASLMSEAVLGRTVEEALALADATINMIVGEGALPSPKLAALQGVREFPMRVKCGTFAWHALRSALADV
jgi:nitrogen fixation NifU-like protein